jgi:hypothetical protein
MENDLIKPASMGSWKENPLRPTFLKEFLRQQATAVDRGEAFNVIYLDFVEAFDKVPHRWLVRKITAHGLSG